MSPVPSSAVMCSLREASASVIVSALKPDIASKGVHFIAELKMQYYNTQVQLREGGSSNIIMRKRNCGKVLVGHRLARILIGPLPRTTI